MVWPILSHSVTACLPAEPRPKEEGGVWAHSSRGDRRRPQQLSFVCIVEISRRSSNNSQL